MDNRMQTEESTVAENHHQAVAQISELALKTGRSCRPLVVLASLIDFLCPPLLLTTGLLFAQTTGHFNGGFPTLHLGLASGLWLVAIIVTGLQSPAPKLKSAMAFWTSLLSFAPVILIGISPHRLEAWISAFSIPIASSFIFMAVRPIWMRTGFIGRCQNILVVGSSSLSSECRTLASSQLGFKSKPLFRIKQIGPLEPGLSHSEANLTLDRADAELQKGIYDALVLAIPESFPATANLEDLAARAKAAGCDITTDRGLYEKLTGSVPVEYLPRSADTYHYLLPPKRSSLTIAILRRIVDLSFAIPGIAVMVMLMPLVWAANLLSGDRGPLFYKQVRVGLGGALYSIWKFRTMRVDAEKGGARWASKDDPRITQVGKFMRLTRIDEIPQFINVLKGEMTLVGPRPERPELVEVIKKDVPFYELRHLVKPGITGWAQVKFRYGASVEDSLTKLRFDLQYVRHNSILTDLWIILRTPMIMLEKIGY